MRRSSVIFIHLHMSSKVSPIRLLLPYWVKWGPGPADRAGTRQDGIGPPETTAGNSWATDNRKFLQKNKEQPAEKAPECSWTTKSSAGTGWKHVENTPGKVETEMGKLQADTRRWAPSNSRFKGQRDVENEKPASETRDHNSYPC